MLPEQHDNIKIIIIIIFCNDQFYQDYADILYHNQLFVNYIQHYHTTLSATFNIFSCVCQPFQIIFH